MDQAFKSDTWKWLWLKWEGQGWKESKRWGGCTVLVTLCNFPYKCINYHVKSAEIFFPVVLLLTTREQKARLHTTRWDQTSTQPKVPSLSLSHLVQAGHGNGTNRCPAYPQWCPSLSHSKHRAFCTRGRDFAFHTHLGLCLVWIHSATCLKSCEGLTFIRSHGNGEGFFSSKGCWVVHSTSIAFLGKIGKAPLCRYQTWAFKASRHNLYVYKPKGKSKNNPKSIEGMLQSTVRGPLDAITWSCQKPMEEQTLFSSLAPGELAWAEVQPQPERLLRERGKTCQGGQQQQSSSNRANQRPGEVRRSYLCGGVMLAGV